MSQEQFDRILRASQPVVYMVFGGQPPPTPQQNANAAWRALGDEMGFEFMTATPSTEGDRVFFAEAIKALLPAKEEERD
jgi:hypothetical protein